jgi:small GTP-binding protein
MAADFKWKIVMVGEFAVGKTSLVRRFVNDEFSDSYLTTIGVKVTKKEAVINDKVSADLLLWDIAGSDKFTQISPEYIKGASAGIIVADITRKNTIETLSAHADLLKSVNPGILIAAALNKSDLVENPQDSLKLYESIFNTNNIKLFLGTSAKSGLNVENLFNKLSTFLYEVNTK